ncbi:MAG: hypothetical protein J6T53_00085, partial [Bacteroidales bacterium]|nr:hypothetical protein [Bacteroidales bacterium]
MKRFFVIAIILSALFFSCVKQSETIAEPQTFVFSSELMCIDSLMQHDADSALQSLLSFRADSVISTEAQRSGEISCHYQSLLLSEALYKTYNPQYYRNELQSAMRFFDSIYSCYPTNDKFAMLAARSHYMNGVGFYENDSVVEACKEYLHTLEIMED